MRQIAFMYSPGSVRQHVQLDQTVDGLLLRGAELRDDPLLVGRGLALRVEGGGSGCERSQTEHTTDLTHGGK